MKSAHINSRPPPKSSKKPDMDELYRLYVDEYTTAKRIGEIYGVSETAAFNWLKSYDIDRRSIQDAQLKGKIVPTTEQLYKMYIDNADTLTTIGDRYAVTGGTVSRWLNKACIKRRSLSESQMNGECRPDKDELYQLYVEEIIGIPKLGEMFGYRASTIYRWLVADGVRIRPHGMSRRGGRARPNKEVLYQMHIKDRKPLVEIADVFETNRTTIRNWLRDDDIEFMPIVPSDGIRKQPYCIKWTEKLREEIRDKFDRKCFICGKTEEDNGAKLSVHHTNSGKMCMCDYSCELVPLCKRCHGKTIVHRYYWYSLIMCKLLLESSAQFTTLDLHI